MALELCWTLVNSRVRCAGRFGAAAALCLALLVIVASTQSLRAQELRLITSPWPPSNYLDEAGRPTGLSVAVVEALKTRLDVTAPIEVIPWARGYLTAQTKPNVILFTAGRTKERLDMGFEFIGPIVMWSHVLLAPTGSPLKVKDLDAARAQNLTVAGVRGSWQINLVADAGINVVETEDHETAARMLLAGRVDLWITSRLQASAVLQGLGNRGDAVTPVYTVRKSPSYLMVSKGTDPAILKAWREAYAELLLTDFCDKTAEDWSAKLGLPISFRKEEGFVADTLDLGDTGS
ncbi:substrate-binding periplasmic protein [Roseibium sediminicola]|uniref:Transporter substrate-binding domain-containing protein n=1 Tax=Roseibium sediminicola TaxID=2933272 RepID=A0ABT0GTD1_9HYPH|nr:transporter substrate-binding domain-containing protein [Roseibium sp. CAU 1639]MCK7612698.1 transporter substrate-binding domain-containing protein [Roseibium sp. CAU 1639]